MVITDKIGYREHGESRKEIPNSEEIRILSAVLKINYFF